MKKIIIVNAERKYLSEVSAQLRQDGFDVETHVQATTARQSLHGSLPALAIVSMRMPGHDGFELLQSLRQQASFPIIAVDDMGGEVEEVMALRLGADDYLLKTVSPKVISERVRALLRRQAIASGQDAGDRTNRAISCGELVVDPQRHSVFWHDREILLTATEFNILKTLAARPGVVRSRNQLMDIVYGDRIYVDDRTIDSHIKRLRKKLREAAPDTQPPIETLYGVGYKFKAEVRQPTYLT